MQRRTGGAPRGAKGGAGFAAAKRTSMDLPWWNVQENVTASMASGSTSAVQIWKQLQDAVRYSTIHSVYFHL